MKRNLKCNHCHKVKPDVRKCNDPYQEDVNGVEIKTKLCEDCYQELIWDI